MSYPKRLMKWTPQAIDCYRQKTCDGCFIRKMMMESNMKCKGKELSYKIWGCKMRSVIIELVRVLGKPTDEMLKKVF